ncbi:MAG: nuclear transport factor 2 family protein [Sphingobacteriales bacterium]|nr:nuclear transport factor 2 family protein [Sphingobacteriales bacterium]
MKKIILFTAFLFISFTTFSQEKEIRNVLETQRKAWNRGDIPAFMQGYWKSDSLMFFGSKGPTYGWTKTLENYQKNYPDKAAMGILTFDVKEVRMLDETHAFVLGAWHLQRAKDEPHGFFTLLFQKFGNEWKIIVDHTS